MTTLREVKRKLHSVKNIQKITKAMEMVAAFRLKKAQVRAEKSRPYFTNLKEMLDNLISGADDFVHPLIDKREIKKIGFVVIAGDRGLCGSYNQNVFSAADKILQKHSKEQVELILVGKKAVDYFFPKGWKINHTLTNWGGKITFVQIKEFSQYLMDQYLNFKFDEIFLIYTHYIGATTRNIVIEKLLKIDKIIKQESSLQNYIIEPTTAEVLTEILPHYCITKIQSALNEAYASELAARVFSLRAATENAYEMIDKLTLLHNQIRQSTITRELVEITSCAESLK